MRFLLILAGFVVILFAFFFWKERESTKKEGHAPVSMAETIRFKTKDNVEIVGDYYPEESSRGVVLLHMMPVDRKSWSTVANKLAQAGFQVLAIDLRGHGESQGGPDGFKKFSDQEHQDSLYDVEASAEFLRGRGVTELHLVGASIGANLSLEYLAKYPEARSAILLSPGLDYRGIKTDLLVRKLKEPQKIYFVASREDEYSYESVNTLVEKLPSAVARDVKFFKNAGHGTTMFESHPELVDDFISWFSRQ